MNWKEIGKHLKDGSLQIQSAIGLIGSDLSTTIANTDFFKSLNNYTSELSKSMDAEFLKEGISKVIMPNNHRIMDSGHDFFTTIEKARELGEKNNWSEMETFEQWANSYFTDLSSNAGMPTFGKFSDEIYTFLRSINISEENARDFVTLNGQEAIEAVLGTAIAGVAIFFAWKSEDKEKFSKTIASLYFTSAISLNPVLIIIATIGLAVGYQNLICKEAMARGAILSSAGLVVSSIIPGPVILGLLPALIATIYLNKKMGTDFKPIENSQQIITLLKSEEFRENCEKIFKQFEDAVKKEKIQA